LCDDAKDASDENVDDGAGGGALVRKIGGVASLLLVCVIADANDVDDAVVALVAVVDAVETVVSASFLYLSFFRNDAGAYDTGGVPGACAIRSSCAPWLALRFVGFLRFRVGCSPPRPRRGDAMGSSSVSIGLQAFISSERAPRWFNGIIIGVCVCMEKSEEFGRTRERGGGGLK
jgi:hypothetical protein